MDYASFYVGDCLFGLPIALVQEISRVPEVFPIPGHDLRIEGLINLRGRATVVINVKKCLFKEDIPSSIKRRPKLLILEPKEVKADSSSEIQNINEPIVLMVDDMYKIIEDEKQAFHPPPAHVHEEYIEGVMKVNDNLITLLSISRLINSLTEAKGV